MGSDPGLWMTFVDDPAEALLATVFDCAVRQNMPSCTISWKCDPADMRCVTECTPCPVCGGRLVHYRKEHEEAGAMEGWE